MLKTLAITLERCSGCAIFSQDKILFSASEERYSRIKSDESYPKKSIDWGLKTTNIDPKELDRILLCGTRLTVIPPLLHSYSKFSVSDHLMMMDEYWKPKLSDQKTSHLFEIFNDKLDFDQFPYNTEYGKKLNVYEIEHPINNDTDKIISNFFKTAISDHIGVDEEKIEHIDHHTCHANYAFYASPIRDENTLVVTLDAWGDDLSGTISVYDKKLNQLNRLREFHHKDFQLGRIYRYVTLLLRMLPSDHEYKVMGLAPYYDGKVIRDVEEIFSTMQKFDGKNFSFNKNINNIFEYLKENLSTFRFDHISAGIQSFTEKILENFFKSIVKEFNSNCVVFSGGLSMNVKANLKISQIPEIKKFFVVGGGGDETLPIGACYHFAEQNNILSKPLDTLYLGNEIKYDEKQLEIFQKFQIEKFHDNSQILEPLLNGEIIATCIGKMEMGPRALGNRSILADPRDGKNIETINRMIKNRDFWMPFAPIILEEYQDQLIKNPKQLESPHMTIAFETIDGKEKIPAGVHRYDGSARAQILKKHENPVVWNLINDFYEKTGIPALLNTSFNLHGEPLVNDINDALHVFKNSGLKLLLLQDHIIKK